MSLFKFWLGYLTARSFHCRFKYDTRLTATKDNKISN